jgi:hypothetical protein
VGDDQDLVVRASDAAVHGYSAGLLAGALVPAAAAVLTALVVNADRQTPTHHADTNLGCLHDVTSNKKEYRSDSVRSHVPESSVSCPPAALRVG